MTEADLTVPSGEFLLECRFDESPEPDTAVVCHPHPLYGGNMDNNVVWTLKKALKNFGWGTLRFNSRGVGQSTGHYGDGDGETADLLAVVEFLKARGTTRLHLAGYSYGAWIGLKAVSAGFSPLSCILVSPPVDFIGFGGLTIPKVPCLITLGIKDDFCRVSSLEKWLSGQNFGNYAPEVEIIPRCDHFYWGWESALASTVDRFLQKHFPG